MLARAGIEYQQAKEMLSPLAQVSIANAARSSDAMTGPASRGDLSILDAHRAALGDHDLAGLQQVYDILSDRIIEQASENKSSR